MIWKVIRRNISTLQMVGYGIAATIGLTIMLCTALFYRQAAKAIGGEDGSPGLIVASRPVSALASFGVGKAQPGFTPEQIADIENQPWATAVGKFTPADFRVSAGVDIDGRGFSTQLFLESVPDQFIDNMPEGWNADPGAPGYVIPVILPRDYLALYNFGFAASRGLPQMSESMISRIPISVYLYGNGLGERIMAKVAGFSDRINTIAVPEAFMQWANNRYGNDSDKLPSRLLIKTAAPGDPAIDNYFESHGISRGSEDAASGHASYILKLFSGITAGVGAAICALALFILLLSTALLMQKNREVNATLLFLGYSPWRVARVYIAAIAAANLAVAVVAAIIAIVVSQLWQKPLAQLGAAGSGGVIAVIIALAVMTVATLAGSAKIRAEIVSEAFCAKEPTQH